MSALNFPAWASKICLILCILGFMFSIALHFLWVVNLVELNKLTNTNIFTIAFILTVFPPLYELFKGLKINFSFRENFDNVEMDLWVEKLWKMITGYLLVFCMLKVIFGIERIEFDNFFWSVSNAWFFLAGVWYHSSAIKIQRKKRNGLI